MQPYERPGQQGVAGPDTPGPDQQPSLNPQVPHPARVYDYWLGGKTNFAADREIAQAIAAHVPSVPLAARANRAFLTRVTRWLVREAGVRQFLDIGTGVPTSPNLHEVAQEIAPEVRVVYVDNDPVVHAHAQALLASHPAGRAGFILADLRDPEAVLAHPTVTETLDLKRPVALMLVAVLHFLSDADDPRGIVARLLDPLPPGSYLAITHATAESFDPKDVASGLATAARAGYRVVPRNRTEVERFFDGLELVEPGVVPVDAWRPEGPTRAASPSRVLIWAGVGRKHR